MTQYGSSWTEALQGSIETGGAMVTPFLRSRRLRWGTTDDELEGSYPGDDLVPDPQWTATDAILIDATSQRILPWIAQTGQGRGGFYSYQKLENLAGSGIENTSRILDGHQHIRAGDPIRLHVQAPPMTVATVEGPRTLVLWGIRPKRTAARSSRPAGPSCSSNSKAGRQDSCPELATTTLTIAAPGSWEVRC